MTTVPTSGKTSCKVAVLPRLQERDRLLVTPFARTGLPLQQIHIMWKQFLIPTSERASLIKQRQRLRPPSTGLTLFTRQNTASTLIWLMTKQSSYTRIQ